MRINWNGGYKDVDVKDESYRFREIMGENSLTLYFALPNFIEFPQGAYVNFQAQRYTLNSPQILKKINDTHFEYTLILESEQALLHNYKIKDVSGRLKFPITAKPLQHLDLLVRNLNQNDSGWSVGSCITSAEKLISYNHNTCRESLQLIAEAFNTEWEVVGKTIHLRKVEYNKSTPLPLSYGKGNGFRSGVGRTNDDSKKGFNVLYVQGGERNVDYSKYGNKDLLLPKNQQYIHEGVPYVSDAKGLSIQKNGVVITNRREASLDLTNIYPKREGAISIVTVKDAEKNFYDFTDTNIPDALDYSKHLIANDEDLLIQFESGMLSGREFSAKYIHESKRFEIKPSEQDGYTMPNDTFKPAVGDKYAVFNMMMPNEYICDNTSKTGASWEMMKEACKYFYENTDSKFSFTGEVDGIWAKKDWVNIGGKIKTGGYISFSDNKFQPSGILIRIQSVKDYINNPHNPKVELSNSVQGKSIYSEIFKAKEVEVLQGELHKRGVSYSRRQWQDAKQTMKMLELSVDGYSKGINPLTVETMSLLIGNEALQFVFVDSKRTPVPKLHNIIFSSNNQLLADGGILQHKTLGTNTLKPSRTAEDYKYWNIPQYTSSVVDNTEAYFLYAKCSKTNETGSFVLSKTAIKIESVSGYYHFLVGVLNSEIDGQRSFTTLYGFTEILPGRINVDKIVSVDGKTYFDLLNGIIGGKITFTSGNSNIDLATWAGNTEVSVQKADSKAQNAFVKAQQVEADNEAKLLKLQAQIDNEISSYAYPYKPTSANYPASEWTTEELKLRHDKDVFFNNKSFVDNATTPDAGKAWRWMKISGVWKWNQIADSDTVKALKEASKAQAMADGKSTLFGFTPNSVKADGFCYRQGDSWILNADKTVNGTAYKQGEILTASQDSTVFNEGHWLKRIRYTDAETAEAKARELIARTEKTVDLLALDKNKYYPVTVRCFSSSRFKIEVSRDLILSYGKPSYATHPNGFTCNCSWETNGSGWGSIPVKRIVLSVVGAWHTGNVFGSIGQMEHSSLEYIYLRGGSKYDIKVSGTSNGEIALHKESYTTAGQTINVLASVSPVVTTLNLKIADAKKEALKATGAVDKELKEFKKAAQEFETEVNGAFRDGVISEAEAKAIEKYKNTVATEKADVDAQYDKIYADGNLTGATKTNLAAKKTAFNTAYNNLVNAIDTAIADWETTPGEKNNVDARFSAYRTDLGNLRKAFEEGIKAIEDKKISELHENIKQSINASTLFAKDKPFPVSSHNEYITDADAQGGVALRVWRGWSSNLFWKNQLNFLKIGAKYRVYIRCRYAGSVGVDGVKFGWYNGKAGDFYLTELITKEYKLLDVGCFTADWKVSSNPYLWFLSSNSFLPNDGSNGSGLYIDWIRFVEANIEDITDTKIAEAKKESSVRNFKVRYIRDWLNGSNKNAGNHWVEIQAYRKNGSNVAQGKSVTCSQGMLEAHRVTDNKFAVYAESVQDKLSNVVVDLGAQYDDITHVKVWHYFADGRTYKETRTEVSADGKTWFPIFDSYLQGTYTENSKGHKILVNASTAIELANERIEKLRNELNPTKQQADYLAKALKQSTEIHGGLVLGSIIAVRGADGKVTAYMSGDRALNIAAFKAGVEYFGTQGEKHNIALNHEGTADLGVLRVEKGGDVRVYDSTTGEERFAIIKKDIQNLDALQSASTFSLSDTGDSLHLIDEDEQFIPNLSLDIPKFGGKLDVQGVVSISVRWRPPSNSPNSESGDGMLGLARADISVELFKDGVSRGVVWSYSDLISGDSPNLIKDVGFNESVTAEQGTYTAKIKTSVTTEMGSADSYISLSNPKFSWKLQAQNYRKINIGLDGLFATYPDKLLYFSEQKGLVVDGPTDMPGLLATGSSSQYGSVSNLWGAKASANRTERKRQGVYRVYHNIGHSNYTAQGSSHTPGVTTTTGIKTATYFEIHMKKNGNYYDSSFEYFAFGRNF